MVASAHRHLSALAFAHTIAPNAKMLGIPDEKDALTSQDDILAITKERDALTVVDAPWEFDLHGAIPYNTPGTLVVHYLYRDMANYKRRSTLAIEGTFAREDIAIIIGALSAGDDASFIPMQVGMEDLQFGMETTPDFDDQDHVWHTLDGLGWRLHGTHDVAWKSIKPLWLERVNKGYDCYEALMEYERRLY